MFLSHALVLGEKLLRACSTPSGLPYSNINLGNGAGTGTPWASGVRFLLRGEGPCQTCFAPFPRTPCLVPSHSRVLRSFLDCMDCCWLIVGHQSIIIAEAASILVEFTQLSRLTGDKRFSDAVSGGGGGAGGSELRYSTLAGPPQSQLTNCSLARVVVHDPG